MSVDAGDDCPECILILFLFQVTVGIIPEEKRKCIFLKFKTSSGKDLEVVDELVSRTADYLGGNLSQNADTTENAEAGGRGVADAVCIKMEDYYLLGVFFADGSQKNAGLTEKDFNKISKAVEKAFPAVG